MKEKVILAYSGGLDTTVIIPWLKENYDFDVVCVCINVGQGNELDGLLERAKASGAVKLYIEDVVEELVGDILDETDTEEIYVETIGKNEWIVDWPLNIDKFCIGYFKTGSTSPNPKYDTNGPLDTTSFAIYYQNSTFYASAIVDIKLAIQVYVEQTATAGKSMIAEPSGMWLNGVVSNNSLLKNGVQQVSPNVINSEAVSLKKLQNKE